MTEEEVKTEIDAWTTHISKYIISRSSRLLSADTQKDGRILLGLSALSSLLWLGIANVPTNKLSMLGFDLKLNGGATLMSIVIELVCLYFALSFANDAYSDLKIWQFKSMVKGSDEENPAKILEREAEVLIKESNDIIKKYEELEINKKKELGLNLDPDAIFNLSNIVTNYDTDEEVDKKFEESQKWTKFAEYQEECMIRQKNELDLLKVKKRIFQYKQESTLAELPAIVRAYKFKKNINIIFPFISFLISIFSLIHFYIQHTK